MDHELTMIILETPLGGLFEVLTKAHGDKRGRFTRLFCATEFATVRPDLRFVQVNHSVTAERGTIRGLHFQMSPAGEAKLIRCLRGAVYDVAVDLRFESPTFGKWHAIELSAENERQIFIPEGFAHGFQTLTDNAELLYQHTVAYTPACEGGVRFNDPSLAIAWPLQASIVSERDATLPFISSSFMGLAA